MPVLVDPALPAGSLRRLTQPDLRSADGLLLRPWRPADQATARRAFDCPDIQRWHVRRLDSAGEAGAWISGWAASWAAETAASWAVVRVDDDRCIGQVGLRAVALAEASAHLSYWVLPDARRAGVATRAVHLLTRWAFETIHLHRLVLVHSTANPASCRVARATGFALEGTLRSELRHADGRHDAHLHARLRPDPPVGAAEAG